MLRDVGASRGAFYRYFGCKQSLLEAVYEAGMAMGCSPNRTVIVEFGKVKAFSDVHPPRGAIGQQRCKVRG